MNQNLQKAKNSKMDDFYTQIEDVEKELRYYTEYFKNKIIYCNCDNPSKSAFWKYFHLNFKRLGLKKLIATHLNEKGGHVSIYMGGHDSNILFGSQEPLKGDGDFRSTECTCLLKESDIVVTNPPFSLFREYISQILTYNKKFIILGNMNAVTYKEVFPSIKDNKVWYGASIHSGDRKFNVPDNYPLEAATCGIDENGKKYIKVKGVRWFVNIDHNLRHKQLELQKRYAESLYPMYDNFNAINIKKYSEIPIDYDGIMGVPITFLDFYNPEQFKILSCSAYSDKSKFGCPALYLNGKKVYARILIQKIKDFD